MEITQSRVSRERQWVEDRASVVVPLANDVRARLGDAFGVTVGEIDEAAYLDAVDLVFEEPARAVNVTALIGLLRELDIQGDYPGFVVDEYLGRELAATIAGEQSYRLLAEATFHVADIYHADGGTSGADDLDAALAAGFQTRLPGWDWRTTDPFENGRS